MKESIGVYIKKLESMWESEQWSWSTLVFSNIQLLHGRLLWGLELIFETLNQAGNVTLKPSFFWFASRFQLLVHDFYLLMISTTGS